MGMSTIKLSKETKDKLRSLGKMGDSYEDVIREIIEFYKEEKRGK